MRELTSGEPNVMITLGDRSDFRRSDVFGGFAEQPERLC